MNKGDVYYANLGSTTGSEQAGLRPVLIFQNITLFAHSRTVIIIPFTTSLRRAQIPGCVLVRQGEGGLPQDSVALCYQIRAIDRSRLQNRLGSLTDATINEIENALNTTFDMN